VSIHPAAELPRQLIADAGEALSNARTLLVQPTPQNLAMACSALAMAISRVADLQRALTLSPTRDVGAAAAGLRKEVGLISSLLEHAASYHVNLLQCMIEASGPEAQPAPYIETETPRRMSLDA
jgi:hypothetical protein